MITNNHVRILEAYRWWRNSSEDWAYGGNAQVVAPRNLI